MSEEQFETALQRLYEEISVRDELTDEESEALMRWGEAQIERLAGEDMDDESFDAAYDQLVKLMGRMNRLAAQRAHLSAEDQTVFAQRISESAAALHLPLTSDRLTAYFSQPVAFSDEVDVAGVIALFDPAPPTPADSTPQPPAPDPVIAPPTPADSTPQPTPPDVPDPVIAPPAPADSTPQPPAPDEPRPSSFWDLFRRRGSTLTDDTDTTQDKPSDDETP